MYLTRYKINKFKNKVKLYLKNNKKIIIKKASYICRSNIIANLNIESINNIEFIYNDVDKHWAETDCNKIYLNTYKNFSDNSLFLTLLHETFHGMIKKNNSEISEYLEHKIIYFINKKLI
jgi:hypothetical protein